MFGARFTVRTDNTPLTYVLSTAKLDATGHRWLADLATFNFNIEYRAGKRNIDADALSRLPGDSVCLGSDVVSAVCQATTFVCSAEVLAVAPEVVQDLPSTPMSLFSSRDWSSEQAKDPLLSTIMDRLNDDDESLHDLTDPRFKPFLRELPRFVLKHGVLHRRRTIKDEDIYQLVVPPDLRHFALHGVHQEMGHPGCDRTLGLLQSRFYWPSMRADVKEWVKTCGNCIHRKSTPDRAPLVSITTTQPLELVCLDFLGLEESKGGIKDILVITDHFTRYAIAIPTRNQTARVTAEALFHNFILHYGFPLRLHSDQGRNFESKIIAELCQIGNVQKSRTTPYHPMGNGQCERFNRTLLSMLGTTSAASKANWKTVVAPLVHAYNCTASEATGYSPYYLMFGRQPRLPVDLLLGIRDEEQQQQLEYTTYVAALRERLAKAYKVASSTSSRLQRRHKSRYDHRSRGIPVAVGDRVLIKLTGFKGPHKLENQWSKDIYIVAEQPDQTIPVYRVRPEGRTGPVRTLHRNFLLPVGYILEDEDFDIVPTPVPLDRKRASTRARPVIQDSSSSSSESDDSLVVARFADPAQDRLNDDQSRHTNDATPVDHTDATLTEDNHALDDTVHDHTNDLLENSQHELDQPEPVPDVAEPPVADDELILEMEVTEESSEEDHEEPAPTVRRSARQRNAPAWYSSGDYIT